MNEGCCSDTCYAVPDCFLDDPECEARDLILEYSYLLDDLLFCVENPDEDPCAGNRKSKRTRAETIQEALTARDTLQDIGGKKPK